MHVWFYKKHPPYSLFITIICQKQFGDMIPISTTTSIFIGSYFFLQRLLITISLTSCFSNSHLKFVNVSRFSVWVSKLSYKSNSSNVVKRSKFSIFFRRFCRRHKVYGKKKFADTKDWKDIMVTSNFELPSDNITDTSLITIFGP